MLSNELTPLLAIARHAVQLASHAVRRSAPIGVVSKGDRDLSSDADRRIEVAVRQHLSARTPQISFLGEEGGSRGPSDSEFHWILDPIDGTINYLHAVPLCGVSLALVRNGVAELGVVELPFLHDQYHAVRDNGAYVNDDPICVNEPRHITEALVSLDQYSFGDNSHHWNSVRLRMTELLMPKVQRIRMIGASAVELAWLAHGKLDACILFGNKPWDTAAGVLLAREAGAHVLDENGAAHSLQAMATIAVAPTIEPEIMEMVKAAILTNSDPSADTRLDRPPPRGASNQRWTRA